MIPYRQTISPDIEVKFYQIMAHMTDKNKVIQQFCKILKQLCDWQMFNSRNLDKFANSVSKLLIGKDPLKDTFILFQRILASKSDQANKVAVSIKQDMLPFLQQAINLKQQNSIKSQQPVIKDLRNNMHQKVRQLYTAESGYKSLVQKMHPFNSPSSTMTQSRQRIEQINKLNHHLIDAQTYLTETINIYNHTIQSYMLHYTHLCQHLSAIQSQRKSTIKQSISKFIVFEMDAIKNIEYDLCRYAQSIQKMQDKLVIQDKQAASTNPQIRTVQLAKISPTNYIKHLTQQTDKREQKVGQKLMTQGQRKLNQIKKFLDPLNQNFQINRQSYTNLIWDINELLTEAMEVYDMKTLKEIVFYANNYYMLSSLPSRLRQRKQREQKNDRNGKSGNLQNNQKYNDEQLILRRAKIPVLNAILCHPIFKNQSFWYKYSNRLADIVQREISTTSTPILNNGYIVNNRRSDQIKLSLSFLSSDIQFMKKISQAPIVQKIVNKYQKYNIGSTDNFVKSTDSIKSKADSQQSRDKSKTKILPNNNCQLNQKNQVKCVEEDLIYF